MDYDKEETSEEILEDLRNLRIQAEWSKGTSLPKSNPTLVGMPAVEFHRCPMDEMPTPKPRAMSRPPLRRRGDSVTVPSASFNDIQRQMIVPASSRGGPSVFSAESPMMPSDAALAAAQLALDEAMELDRFRDTLLAFPSWVPVSEPMMCVASEARWQRQIAANLIGCRPIDLED